MNTWALIADGTWARIVINDGRAHAWAAIDGMVFGSAGEFDATKDIGADDQIHSVEMPELERDASETPVVPLRTVKTLFAQQLSDVLAGGLEAGAYERLIIAAPPKMLRDLKLCLSAKVMSRIAGESNDDLTKVPVGDLGAHLEPMQLV
ncbi:MAG: host attachment protein [Ancalomicrobiaceae bacterium]|nr:host attachment protein [Ancalomicrobiaceae bacterium]